MEEAGEAQVTPPESDISQAEVEATPSMTRTPRQEPAVTTANGVEPNGCGQTAPDSSPPTYVYAIGNIRPAYPSLSVEKAFDQAVAQSGTNLPDYALQYAVLSQGQNIYITREMCWIMQIDCVDTYIIKPRSYLELYEMVSAIMTTQAQSVKRYDVIIGPRGPIATPDLCAGLQLPIVICNQIYSFTYDEFVTAMSNRIGVSVDDVGNMFYQMLQLADNAGETSEHRALNYLMLRYPEIYKMAAGMLGHLSGPYYVVDRVFSLAGVIAQLAPVQGVRTIVDLIFNYQERTTGGRISWYCEVDVSGQFPFLVRPLTRYYPHP